jgi:hypothetical protein
VEVGDGSEGLGDAGLAGGRGVAEDVDGVAEGSLSGSEVGGDGGWAAEDGVERGNGVDDVHGVREGRFGKLITDSTVE